MREKGEPPAEIEGAKSSAGISTRILLRDGNVLEAEETLQEGVNGDRYMPLATPDR